MTAAVESYVDTETGVRIYRSGDLETVHPPCEICGRVYVPFTAHQRACSTAACQQALNRARNHRWAVAKRRVTRPQPWLLGAPPYGSHLPGGGVELHVSPPPAWAVEHRHVRLLHGLVTALLGHEHAQTADVALVPWPSGLGWGLYVRDEEAARSLASREHDGVLFDRPVRVRCGPLVRLRAPIVRRRGHQRVRVDTVTPVVISTLASTVTHLAPTSESLRSTLSVNLARRLGLEIDPATLPLEIVEHDTRPERVPIGGTFGVVPGWSGRVVVDTNAVGRWLLECAARIGLGGSVALGFGRVRVSDAS
jgi:hypothetical protein